MRAVRILSTVQILCLSSLFLLDTLFFGLLIEGADETYNCTGQAEGALRLQGTNVSSHAAAGRVEFCHDGIWGLICANNWRLEEARIACRQLGYGVVKQLVPADLRAWITAGNYTDSVGERKMWLDHVWCSGQERKLRECRYANGNEPITTAFQYHINCSENGRFEVVGVVCTASTVKSNDLASELNEPRLPNTSQSAASTSQYTMNPFTATDKQCSQTSTSFLPPFIISIVVLVVLLIYSIIITKYANSLRKSRKEGSGNQPEPAGQDCEYAYAYTSRDDHVRAPVGARVPAAVTGNTQPPHDSSYEAVAQHSSGSTDRNPETHPSDGAQPLSTACLSPPKRTNVRIAAIKTAVSSAYYSEPYSTVGKLGSSRSAYPRSRGRSAATGSSLDLRQPQQVFTFESQRMSKSLDDIYEVSEYYSQASELFGDLSSAFGRSTKSGASRFTKTGGSERNIYAEAH